jgi:hypothetical protein
MRRFPPGHSLDAHIPNIRDYVEKNMHEKRHLFANYLLQYYPANLQRQGNSPAEANHSSVLQRLGRTFCDSPLMLIRALLQRYAEISAKRLILLQTYHLKA